MIRTISSVAIGLLMLAYVAQLGYSLDKVGEESWDGLWTTQHSTTTLKWWGTETVTVVSDSAALQAYVPDDYVPPPPMVYVTRDYVLWTGERVKEKL